MKELDKVINGRGEVRGFVFTQRMMSDCAYMYESFDGVSESSVYEVFRRVENNVFDNVSYPSRLGFGDSKFRGKCFRDYDRAVEYFNYLTAYYGSKA